MSLFVPLTSIADIIKVDVFGMTPPELFRITKSIESCNAVLLAEKIEDRRMFLLARALGYTLFSGLLFQSAGSFSRAKISMGSLARLRLLSELLREDYEVKKLSKIIIADASLSLPPAPLCQLHDLFRSQKDQFHFPGSGLHGRQGP